MQLFFNPNIDENTKEILFDKEESRHIIRVLRKKQGDILHITNGKGSLFSAEIIIESDKKCVVKIVDIQFKEKEWNYYLHVAIAPTKNIDRLEWFIEKATEIGIDEITPIICENSERKVVKHDRLHKIMLSAVKQSLKYTAPKLNDLTSFNDFIKNSIEGNLLIAHCNEGEKKALKSFEFTGEKITILIGPEGDFSPKETLEAIKSNFIPITLGDSRLRTETAGIVAVHSISFLH
ncbi:16S rRNA (uracil1498-N3)-methyltransferase [Tenacibaculum skagerrakense]|uniref:Ribosomal RNA small subunit methyltransferase E n=1 Tax=Tenacibaculum skagerrakense TaxID=186571 RepID=A0A4R2NY42_9FLAO|nr:16S rRNA (uracil(1498)-N(3))-methyltransferase [Tenacibaculum skagerrakense]TCP26997.1 16S rRNA (uracil1498-N3)-methyltransferase [Tenacibaculum skagerrakense]